MGKLGQSMGKVEIVCGGKLGQSVVKVEINSLWGKLK